MASLFNPTVTSRSYYNEGCPDLAITADTKKQESILQLQAILEKKGIWQWLGGRLEKEHGLVYLYFPGRVRALIPYLFLACPEVFPFINNGQGVSCIRHQCAAAVSKNGLLERLASIHKFNDYICARRHEAIALHKHEGKKSVACALSTLCKLSDIAALVEIFQTKKFRIACIGELHDHNSQRKFVIENAKALKAMRVHTVFSELLPYALQPLIDKFLQGEEMHPLLLSYVRAIDRQQRYPASSSLETLLRAAREAGIRVVGLETVASEETKKAKYANEEEQVARAETFNNEALKVISNEMPAEGNALVLAGILHTGSFHSSLGVVPGLADVLGCPNIFIRDDDKEAVEYKESIGHVHMNLSRE